METKVVGFIRSITPNVDSIVLELVLDRGSNDYLELLDLINKNCTIMFRTVVLEGK